MKARRLISCAFLALVMVSTAQAQTDTTITYQGELKQSGQPASGSYNLTFSLWNASASGAQVGSDIVINSVPVADGNFAVQLDFGAAAFNNTQRWLEIEVNGQTLAPRQLISRSPYSIQTRGIFVDAAGRVGIGTTNPTAELYVDGSASTTATSVVVHHPGGATGDLSISSPGGSVGLIVHANGGNRRDIRFSDDGIQLLTNSTPSIPSSLNGLSILESGKVGIGVSDPLGQLEVNNTGSNNGDAISGFTDNTFYFGVRGHHLATSGSGAGVRGITESASGVGVSAFAANGSGMNYAVQGLTNSPNGYAGYFSGGRNYFEGRVGIGKTNPQYKLDVVGDVRIDGLPTGTGTPIHINGNDQLVRATSSRRYKENIEPQDLGRASEAFLLLEPVSYNYRGSSTPDIGLIAEDVAELVPEMVTYDREGRPEAVKYDKGVLYLLEIVRRQQNELARKDAVIDEILQRLERLERNAVQENRIADASGNTGSWHVAAGARDKP